jgi:hypothetical protein
MAAVGNDSGLRPTRSFPAKCAHLQCGPREDVVVAADRLLEEHHLIVDREQRRVQALQLILVARAKRPAGAMDSGGRVPMQGVQSSLGGSAFRTAR